MNDARLSRSLLIVCTVREEEVPESHPVSKLWQRIKDRRQQSPITLTIQNLSFETLEAFVADLLNLNPQQVRELANIAHTRTDENIFFFIQFLTALRDEGLLQYDIGSMKWIWDDSEIRRSTVVATNYSLCSWTNCHHFQPMYWTIDNLGKLHFVTILHVVTISTCSNLGQKCYIVVWFSQADAWVSFVSICSHVERDHELATLVDHFWIYLLSFLQISTSSGDIDVVLVNLCILLQISMLSHVWSSVRTRVHTIV